MAIMRSCPTSELGAQPIERCLLDLANPCRANPERFADLVQRQPFHEAELQYQLLALGQQLDGSGKRIG
jgi:hypothetical protein